METEEDPEVRYNITDPGHGKAAAVELADAHLAVHGPVITHDAAGINFKPYFTIAFLLYFPGEIAESVGPDASVRGKRSNLEKILRVTGVSLPGK